MSTSQKRALRRSKSNRIIAGVCGGLAEFYGISSFWFRLALVIAFINLLHLVANDSERVK